MSRALGEAGAPQLSELWELQVWTAPFRSWFVSSVIATMFVTPSLKRVLSAGLSVVRRMYCAPAGTLHSINAIQQARIRDGARMEPSSRPWDAPLLQDRDQMLELTLRGRAADVVDAGGQLLAARSPAVDRRFMGSRRHHRVVHQAAHQLPLHVEEIDPHRARARRDVAQDRLRIQWIWSHRRGREASVVDDVDLGRAAQPSAVRETRLEGDRHGVVSIREAGAGEQGPEVVLREVDLDLLDPVTALVTPH